MLTRQHEVVLVQAPPRHCELERLIGKLRTQLGAIRRHYTRLIIGPIPTVDEQATSFALLPESHRESRRNSERITVARREFWKAISTASGISTALRIDLESGQLLDSRGCAATIPPFSVVYGRGRETPLLMRAFRVHLTHDVSDFSRLCLGPVYTGGSDEWMLVLFPPGEQMLPERSLSIQDVFRRFREGVEELAVLDDSLKVIESGNFRIADQPVEARSVP